MEATTAPTRARSRREAKLLRVSENLSAGMAEGFSVPEIPERADGAFPLVIGYARKSSDDPQHQTISIPGQIDRIRRASGQPAMPIWWEALSGTSFEGRKAFPNLLAWCKAHPAGSDDDGNPRGVIWATSRDRFSREQKRVHGRLKPNVARMMHFLTMFEEWGWRWRFEKSPGTGNATGDLIVGTVEMNSAGDEAANTSSRVAEKKLLLSISKEMGGYWVGGPAPYGAVRKDAATGRVLGYNEWVQVGHRIILAPHEEQLKWWRIAAHLVLDGYSPQRVAEILAERGAPLNDYQFNWNNQMVKRMLRNTALIARPVFGAHTGNPVEYQGKWAPLVDVVLFERVNAALDKRAKGAHTSRNEARPLTITCPYCDAVYHHTTRNGKRVYTHPAIGSNRSGDWRARAQAAGCKQWTFDADLAEREALGVLSRGRFTPQYRELMKREHDRVIAHVENASQAEAKAKAALDAARQQRERLSAQMEELDPEYVREWQLKLRKKDDEIRTLQAKWRDARKRTEAADDTWSEFERALDEANDRIQAFEAATLRERAALFAPWFEAIDCHVAARAPKPRGAGDKRVREPGKQKAKRLYFFLRVAPEEWEERLLPEVRGKYAAGGTSGVTRSYILLEDGPIVVQLHDLP